MIEPILVFVILWLIIETYFTELEDDCGGTVTAEVGVFDAPSADEIGMHGRIHHCVWRIMGYFRDKIRLNISNVDIPDYYTDKGFECRESYVQVC